MFNHSDIINSPSRNVQKTTNTSNLHADSCAGYVGQCAGLGAIGARVALVAVDRDDVAALPARRSGRGRHADTRAYRRRVLWVLGRAVGVALGVGRAVAYEAAAQQAGLDEHGQNADGTGLDVGRRGRFLSGRGVNEDKPKDNVMNHGPTLRLRGGGELFTQTPVQPASGIETILVQLVHVYPLSQLIGMMLPP